MLGILFKVIRRFDLVASKLGNRLMLARLHNLYPNRCLIDKSINRGEQFRVYFDDSDSRLIIKDQVVFRNFCELRTGQSGVLSIGEGNFFNNGCSIQCFLKITIGNHCQFGENVKMYDMNHQYQDPGILISAQGYTKAPISIGNNCWIGSNVTILKGVTIGDNVVIGANCLVHKEVPPNTTMILGQQLITKNRNAGI